MNDHRHGCPDGSRVAAPHRAAGSGVGNRLAVRRLGVRRLGPDRSGSIVILVAVGLMLIAATALALDLANLFLVKSRNQRIADQAALAAAFAYSQSSSDLTTAKAAASRTAVANGAGSATVDTSIVTSPSGDGTNAAMVVVTSMVPLSPFGKAISAAFTQGQTESGSTLTTDVKTSVNVITPISLTTVTANHSNGLSSRSCYCIDGLPPARSAAMTCGATCTDGSGSTAGKFVSIAGSFTYMALFPGDQVFFSNPYTQTVTVRVQ
ncbi:MAG: pilus assembly protein TadG-related protein [Rhodopila sp.]|jgi:Flp pilus assembly protein TadG